jgi:uncharacterized protein YeaO (DUF488 family)
MPQPEFPSLTVQLKRAYDPPEQEDGVRVLVDRLWVRGLSKAEVRLDAWMKELGPSSELRQWFGHRPERWEGFQERYLQELSHPLQQLYLAELQSIAQQSTLTLIYGARDQQQNEAMVLRDYLLTHHIEPVGIVDVAHIVLATVASVAAARPDDQASTAALILFAAPFASDAKLEAVLLQLAAAGLLRAVTNGWQLTAQGKRQLQQLVRGSKAI